MVILAFASITPHIKEFIVHFQKISIYICIYICIYVKYVVILIRKFFSVLKNKKKENRKTCLIRLIFENCFQN